MKPVHRLPSVAEYRAFRRHAAWDVPSEARCDAALARSLCGVVGEVDGVAVAMARVIGDGTVSLYVQDVVTHPDHRGRGCATAVLGALIQHLQGAYPADATVGLMAAIGQDVLYAKRGFAARPNALAGPGMYARLGDLRSRLMP